MIIEPERSGKSISDVCIAFGISRETWYKWKRRYDAYGVDGLKNQSRKPHNIKNVKVTEELEKLVLELRLNNRFGPMRIRFRLKRKYGVSLGTKTIYNLLKRHKLNVLAVKLKRKYKRFEMKHPNELVQMDTKGPFYLKASRTKHYLIHVIDDCSRKVVSKWCNRRTSEADPRDSFVKQPPDSISSSIVNSQTRYNSNGKINAVPILVYHNITNTIMDYIIPSHASSTTLDLFAQEMKYLHDNGFRVLLLNQVGYDSHSRNLYGT